MADYPQYHIVVQLDNGMSFTATFGPLPGLPLIIEDELAAVAAAAIRDYDWAALTVEPPVSSVIVTLTRENVVDTGIALP